ncbi:MAG: serine hydrolase domain-containing protein [Thermodesulfobacteriota bacterium]|nr:serine hydrolase domain-containing protein [Thermodesulfobacteriota bacterium]
MKAVHDLMAQAVRKGVFPGAVLLVAREGHTVFFEAFGHARLMPKRTMTRDTVFDLASLTKPLATTLSLMILVQEGRVSLDQTLGCVIPCFSGTPKQGITISQLLSHTSGLPDYRPYYKTLTKVPLPERGEVLQSLLLGEEFICEPGKACFYSDIGFMILERVVEAITQRPFDRFLHKSVYGPLGLKDLSFVLLDDHDRRDDRPYAATEDCPWRGRVLEGEVHDENAHALGGVAGHAGLFGTAQDVSILLLELLETYLGKSHSTLFDHDLVRAFFKRHSDLGSYALGFDTPSRPDSSSGRHFSDQSVGHLGYTGTSFWMDLEKAVMVILLTNRLHPLRENESIAGFRPLLHDTVMDGMGL